MAKEKLGVISENDLVRACYDVLCTTDTDMFTHIAEQIFGGKITQNEDGFTYTVHKNSNYIDGLDKYLKKE